MPIYVYQREDGSEFEELQGINDEPLTICPQTNQSCRRIITRPLFKFKGDGFHCTDYHKKADKIL